MKLAASIFPIVATLLLAGCGGSGGGGNEAGSPEDFETPEYSRQSGLGPIGASSMYERGARAGAGLGTGDGITVAVFDSGATPSHPDLRYGSPHGFLPIYPDGFDQSGHGTHVAGIIAARKNDVGMHGVAFDADIASFRVLDENSELMDPSGADDSLAAGIDGMRERAILITNNSWGREALLVDPTDPATDPGARMRRKAELEVVFSDSLAAYRKYVGAGGVQVWAAGNEGFEQVSEDGGAPYLFPELKAGWLVVAAVGPDRRLAPYSNRCGVAAEWCIAAPGGVAGSEVHSTWKDGGYHGLKGTSMAVPHVSGALAALKSMFPNLDYHEVRDRILHTANRAGRYADEAVYGQGLLDLDAASRPVGGASFALSAHDRGPVAATDGSGLALPSGAFARYLEGEDILVLDSYQRAPFLVPMERFAGASGGGYLRLRDLGLAAPKRAWADEGGARPGLTLAGSGYRVNRVSNGAWSFGTGVGAEVMEGLAGLSGLGLPHGDYRMHRDAVGVALGFESATGELYASAATSPGAALAPSDPGFGVRSWAPRSVLTASFAPGGADYALGASFASDLKRPSGWNGSGAFALSGDSIDFAWGWNVFAGESVTLGVAGRVVHLALEDGPLVSFDDALMASVELDLGVRMTRDVTLSARMGLEQPVAAGEGTIRVARSIDEEGRIGHDDITVDHADLLEFGKAGLSVRYAPGPGSSYGAGVMAVRDGFGETDAIAGVRAEIRY